MKRSFVFLLSIFLIAPAIAKSNLDPYAVPYRVSEFPGYELFDSDDSIYVKEYQLTRRALVYEWASGPQSWAAHERINGKSVKLIKMFVTLKAMYQKLGYPAFSASRARDALTHYANTTGHCLIEPKKAFFGNLKTPETIRSSLQCLAVGVVLSRQ